MKSVRIVCVCAALVLTVFALQGFAAPAGEKPAMEISADAATAPAAISPESETALVENAPQQAASPVDLARLIATHRGKVVVVNFYAAWCPPCRREIPVMNELRAQYTPEQVEIIGVSLDESHASYARFAQAAGISYSTVWASSEAASFYKVSGIPAVLYYSPAGKLSGRVVGLEAKSKITARIDALLAQ